MSTHRTTQKAHKHTHLRFPFLSSCSNVSLKRGAPHPYLDHNDIQNTFQGQLSSDEWQSLRSDSVRGKTMVTMVTMEAEREAAGISMGLWGYQCIGITSAHSNNTIVMAWSYYIVL